MELALGHFLTFQNQSGSVVSKFQNFFIKEEIDGFTFVPFGFSGVTVNRKGDNVDALLLFPNNPISRGWTTSAIQESWLAKIEVRLLDPEDRSKSEVMHRYVGQIAEGGWDDTTVNITLNTVLDAVQARVPARRLTKNLVGNIPTSSGVRLS